MYVVLLLLRRFRADPGFGKWVVRGSGGRKSRVGSRGKALVGGLGGSPLQKLVICSLYYSDLC